MMVSKEMEDETIVGVDMFIESDEQPEIIARQMPAAWRCKIQTDQYQQPRNAGMANRICIYQPRESI